MNRKNMLPVGLGAIAAIAAALVFVFRSKDKKEKPPRKAPQLKIENPGVQSEFTTAASDSQMG
jgi:hypothetical protein